MKDADRHTIRKHVQDVENKIGCNALNVWKRVTDILTQYRKVTFAWRFKIVIQIFSLQVVDFLLFQSLC
jgi:hypothetical protein